jgi:Lon protease-like protein
VAEGEFGGGSVHQWRDLPLFPLKTVLFPGMVLPLHIFEEQYKLMINHCLERACPFGVVLTREGQEGEGRPVPYEVGTTAFIAKVSKMEEGRMNLVAIGSERFRLHAVRYDRPYLVGTAEPWPLADAASEDTLILVKPVRALLRQYLKLLVQAQGHKINVDEVPTEPRTLALLIAIVLQLPMSRKQHLLGQPTVRDMLREEQAIMRREQLILDYIIRTQQEQWEGGSSGYLAKN